jgi:adenylate cyclase class 1
MLPGFAGKDAPRGVAGYQPGARTLAAAARVARSYDHRRHSERRHDIDALFLMGSAGSVAYSRGSDFDLWLCHREDLAEDAVAALQAKAGRVSAWASELGLEVHFFVLTARDLREGRLADLSEESSGTAQRHLLLDEFYRTALLVAGRYPLWWLVPPGAEARYDEEVRRLLDHRFVRAGDVLDLGGLPELPSNEFFGASLWQLYKAIGSPYKSVLKILLLEAYASEYPDVRLLSHGYKEDVYRGQGRLQAIDPYVRMFARVEGYLEALGDAERLELARRSFYLRVRHHLRGRRGDDSWQRDYVEALVRRWGWSEAQRLRLDNRAGWKLDEVLEERGLVMQALTRSYRFLSRFARARSELAAISQEDMNILGRRLFAAFERKSGKLERVREGFGHDLFEPQLMLWHHSEAQASHWLLHRPGAGPRREPAGPPLRRGHSAVELLTWCHVNGVAQPGTRFALRDEGGTFGHRELDGVLGTLRRQLPAEHPAPGVEAFARPAHPVSVAVFINLGVDPLAAYTRLGQHLTTERSDPLNYASRQECLALTADLVLVNSWGEVFCHHYAGEAGLRDCVAEYVGAADAARRAGHALELTTQCLSPDRGPLIATRVAQLLEDAAAALQEAEGSHRRYVFRMGGAYQLLSRQGGSLVHQRLGHLDALLEALAQPGPAADGCAFDPASLGGSPLPCLYAAHRPPGIAFFYLPRRERADIYVLDERGALFHDELELYQEGALLSQFARFFDALSYRESVPGEAMAPPEVRYFRLERLYGGDYQAVAVSPPGGGGMLRYHELQVITARSGGTTTLTAHLGERSFSTLEHGEDLFREVARHVLGLRRGREPYPIYITDLDLGGLVEGDAKAQGRAPTILYLTYKKRIEHQLTAALAAAV